MSEPARSHGASASQRRAATRAGIALMVGAAALAWVPPEAQSQQRATASSDMQVYLGTTHFHTGAFNNHGADASTPADVFRTARERGFDFFVLTEHSGPTGPASPAQFYSQAKQAAAAQTTGSFAALVGYEYSENNDGDSDNGHLTAIGTQDFVSASERGVNFKSFLSYLVSQSSDRAVVAGFNHPGRGHEASARSLLTSQTRRVVTLSETYNQTSHIRRRERRFYFGLIRHLDRGWRVAPTCGLDGHGLFMVSAVETGSYSPCRTGLLAPSLTPGNVVAALQARRTFASRDMNLQVHYTANDRWMGSGLGRPARVRFDIRVTDPDSGRPGDRVRRIDIVGSGGKVLAARQVDSHRATWGPRVPVRRNRYMLVRVFTRDQTSATALAAPVWMG